MPISRDDPIYKIRQQLAAEITRSLGGAESQHVVAPSLGIPQPRMSELSHGRVERYSIEWLIRRIHHLGGSVSVQITLGDVGRAWAVARLRRSRPRRAVP